MAKVDCCMSKVAVVGIYMWTNCRQHEIWANHLPNCVETSLHHHTTKVLTFSPAATTNSSHQTEEAEGERERMRTLVRACSDIR